MWSIGVFRVALHWSVMKLGLLNSVWLLNTGAPTERWVDLRFSLHDLKAGQKETKP